MPAERFPPPHALPPPQAKLPGAKPYKATRNPQRCPVPYMPFPTHLVDDPRFAPDPPRGRPFLWREVPKIKLRGLGPADSIILRHAVARRLFDPDWLYLAPLVPWTPPEPGAPPAGAESNLLLCPDAPMQPDATYLPWEWMARPIAPELDDPSILKPHPPGHPDYPGPLLIEIKPNAGYVALGQVLAYHWAWMRHFGQTWPVVPAILTDLARPYMPDLCAHHAVQLISVGTQIVEPPPWPT